MIRSQTPSIRLATLIAAAAVALGTASSPAQASTWTVDDDGPADFAEIQDAIDAASPGDVILIQGGTYAPFVLDKALTLIGYGKPYAPGHSTIREIPAHGVAVLDGIFLEEVVVLRNQGAVVMSHVSLNHPSNSQTTLDPHMEVIDSADVRLFDLLVRGDFNVKVPSTALEVRRSRVEVVSSLVVSSVGTVIKPCTTLPGQPGILVGAGSYVHAARTEAVGGTGGCIKNGNAAAGGPGALVEASGILFSAGDGTSIFWGGLGGLEVNATHCLGTGDPGSGAVVDGVLIYSGTTFLGGCDYFGFNCDFVGCSASISGPGLVLAHLPDDPHRPNDPTLGLTGAGTGGTAVLLDVIGQKDATAVLFIGQHPVLVEDPSTEIEQLTSQDVSIPLGPVGPAGTLTYSYSTDDLAPGEVRYAQVELTLPSGGILRTNSVPIVVR